MEGKIAAQHDETSLEQLEFPHITGQIRQRLSTPYGEKQLSELLPLDDAEEIRKRLQEVDEMTGLLEAQHYIPLNGLVNILPHLDKVKPENAFLNPDALLEIKNTLKMFSEISRCFKEQRENCPALQFYARGIHSHSQIVRAIESKIEDNGEIPDNASPELRKIRIKLKKIAGEKKKILQQAIKRYSEFSQEEIVTLRDGRMVMGIKQNFVNKVNGIVHGTSGSGATVFVEPMEALQIGNQIQNLKIEERTEIIKILRYLTGLVREVRHDLFYGIENIAVLDLIHAKAKLSVELQAHVPRISEKPVIKLIEARHPLLILKTGYNNVVPLSLELGSNFTTLVITGPNAGGKTVAMKTVGLLILMVQIGLPIPAHPDSEIPLLSGILVDIGDRQSLEHDLSTFSAHIIRLSEILKKANSDSLVLLDEIGTGTDPREGSALAVAILNRLLKMKALTIATTHHGDLKAFAHSTPGAENASMQFNLKNLQPTYHLSMGIPGSSYAFEIAQRYGLDEELVQQARNLVGQDTDKLEELILDLQQHMEAIEKERRELSIKLSEAAGLRNLYERQVENFRREKKEMQRKAALEVQQLLQDTNTLIERLIARIRSEKASRESNIEARRLLRQKKEEIRKILENAEEAITEPAKLKMGDIVYIPAIREEGELMDEPDDKGKVRVLVGNIKMTLDSAGLQILKKDKAESPPVSHRTEKKIDQLRSALKPEIDLRGMDSEEAIEATDRYLSEITGSEWEEVRIIHGKGNGILRKRINEFLSRDKRVLEKRLGKWGEGDTGVTIVKLKK